MNSKPIKVLITDGNQRAALAATRSLAKKGFEVFVGDEKPRSLSGSSKYCKESFIYPSPYFLSEEFVKVIRKECADREIDILLPITEITTYLILQEKTSFESISEVPFPNFSAFNSVSDKTKLLQLAEDLKIPVPQTYFINKFENIYDLQGKLEFPIVMKPGRSRILSGNGWLAGGVRYANDFIQLEKIGQEEKVFREFPFILQEYIKGRGCGIFVLYDRGTPLTYFAHQRLREKPPSGGVSVLCESINVDSLMREYAERLFSKIGWHGIAMVEFKRCQKTGIPYLMEVNARFWGSLQLAIDAGVDFPYLLCQIALKRTASPPQSYRLGIKSRWLLGDLDNLYLTLFSNGLSPFEVSIGDKLKAIYEFLKLIQKNTHLEVLSVKDPKPFLFELRQYLKILGTC